MPSIFRRRSGGAPPILLPAVDPVAEIVVQESSYRSTGDYADYDVAAAVIRFVNDMVEKGQYRRGELPREAFIAYHVDYYVAQVNNGGHAQFAGNSGWKAEVNADIREGLALIGEREAAAIFADFERFAAEHPEAFAEAAEGGGFDGTARHTEALDKRFFAGPTTSIVAANARWLRALPIVRPVPDREYPAEIERLAARNWQRRARQEEAERLAAEAQAMDPLIQAFTHLAAQAKPPLEYLYWRAGHASTEGGRDGMQYGIETSGGGAMVYIFPDAAMLFLRGSQEPAAGMRFKDLERHVRKRTGKSLAEVVFWRPGRG